MLHICGWVPNIEGDVCCSRGVLRNISELGVTKTIPEKGASYTYKCDSDGKEITVSNGSCIVAKIHILHEGGYCSIEIEDKELSLETDVLIEDVWKGFRIIIDGCSDTVCDCVAMIPIYVEFGEGLSMESEDKLAFEKIAERFIRKVERETDGAIRVIGNTMNEIGPKTSEDWKKLWEKSRTLQNFTKSNQLYFERFIDIYRNKFSSEKIEEFSEKMNARCEKAKISYDDNMRRSEYGYKVRTTESTDKRLMIAGKSFRLALCSLIISGLALITTIILNSLTG